MIIIRNSAALERAVNAPIDPTLKELLVLRKRQLTEHDGYDIGDLAHFLIIQPGDTLVGITAELGFSVLINLVDGKRFGDSAFEPSWEHIARHQGWFELTYILSDDGFGTALFIPNAAGVDAELLQLCRTYAPNQAE